MHQSCQPDRSPKKPNAIIVIGNEKGGCGKSTTAMHLAIWLMSVGRQVGTIDLDLRQRSLTRYLENRSRFAEAKAISLSTPRHRVLHPIEDADGDDARAHERVQLFDALSALTPDCDAIIIDCPGSDSHLSRLAHACADVIVTPVNDSFVDIDLLAQVDADTFQVKKPSLYSEMVWEARKRRALESRRSIDWIVMRNRVSSLHAKNKQRVGEVLEDLSKRIGFRLVSGFGERVIYRELFLKGLTLMDLGVPAVSDFGCPLTMSHLAARQELRRLVGSLDIPKPVPEKNLHLEPVNAIS